MKFLEVFRFELNYQLGRYITWIFFVVVLAFAALTAHSMLDNVQKGEYFMNSPVIIALITAVSSMFCLLLTAAVSGNAAVRDIQTGMDPLLYTTSMRKLPYLSGRFMAAFCINLLALIIIMEFILIASVIPGLGDLFMPFRLLPYITSFLIFAVPNALITTALLFSLALLSRRAMSSFLGAGLLFFLALVSMDIIAGEIGLWELGKRLDPSGMTNLRELRLIQTPLEIPTELVKLETSLLFNRLLWIGVACIFLALAFDRFHFGHHTAGSGKRAAKRNRMATGLEYKKWTTPVTLLPDRRVFDLRTRVQQAVFLCFHTFKDMLKGRVWLIMIAILMVVVLAAEEVMEGQLGVPTLPTTWRVLQAMKLMGVGMVVALLITFYTGELVWKERDLRMDEMTDAAPVPDWVVFLSKFSGLILMLLAVQAIIMLAAVLIQLMQGYHEIDLWLYLRVLFGFSLLDLLLFAIVALCIQVLVNQRYLGYLVVFMAYFYMYFPGMLGLEHKLLIFGSGPGWSYSDISGFGPSVVPWLWFRLYWIGWALVLACVLYLFWNRGKEQQFSRRVKQAKMQLSGTTIKIVIPAMVWIILLGGFIFYNTNILNAYKTSEEKTAQQALYEKKYGRYQDTPQPLLSGIKLHAEIFPEKREAEVSGSYQLVNKSGIAIDTIHIATSPGVETGAIEFSRKTTHILIDHELGHRIYKLDEPLQPGDSLSLGFTVYFRQKGFSNRGFNSSVVGNGTYLGYHTMPAIGYETDREITDQEKREKYGLAPRPAVRSVYDEEARMQLAGEEMISFEAVIGTNADQLGVTAGSLHSTWLKKDRRYSRYITDVPIRHNYEIFSAKYAVHKVRWKDPSADSGQPVEIQIFHHPEHTRNLERMVNAVCSSLEYYTEHFSPYPHRQIRLVEYPGGAVGLNGNPVTMSYSEGFTYYAPEKDARELDFPFAIVAHEVAHQWWGNELRPAYVEGAPVLTESLAWYSALMVFEKTCGPDKLELLLRIMRHEYLTPRTAADIPLLRATDKFNVYRKGPFAMYALKQYLGEEQVNSALRRLLKRFGSGEPPLPVSLDLYAELQKETPDSLQYLLKDLFERNTFWELKAEKATAEPSATGVWNVTFELVTKKLSIDEKGIETAYPMNDYVEIGIYANSPEGELGELLYLKKHRLKSGAQTITIKVSKEPDVAGIDPNRLLIDRESYDNFTSIQKRAAAQDFQ